MRSAAVLLISGLVGLPAAQARGRAAADPPSAVRDDEHSPDGSGESAERAGAAVRRVQRAIVAGRYARARRALRQARRVAGVAEADLLALGGLLDLHDGRHQRALVALRRAAKLRPNRPGLHLYIARAQLGLGHAAEAKAALQRGRAAGVKIAGYWLLAGRIELALSHPQQAYRVLRRGLTRFPRDRRLLRDATLVLIRLRLFDAARRLARRYLRVAKNSAWAYLALGEALRGAGRHRDAIALLEEGRLRFPEQVALRARLAYAYADAGMVLTAARTFARLSVEHPRYAHAAAELYRRGGRRRAALRLNARVVGDARRLRQRLSILVGGQRWARALALQGSLARAGLLDDERRYLLAYAHLRAGHYDRAAALAGAVEKGPLARDARAVREAAERRAAREASPAAATTR